MITSIRLVNFKNFADETLRVGPFTVIVGANASGKSNIRDAFRFLHGIGRDYTLAEIIGGKYGPGGQREWEPIRGAANEIIRFGQETFSIEVEILWGDGGPHSEKAQYMIEVGLAKRKSDEFEIKKEKLIVESETSFTAQSAGENLRVRGVWDREQKEILLESNQAALRQLMEYFRVEAVRNKVPVELISMMGWINYILSDIHFPELSPDRMREPSLPGAEMLGNFGENLPTVLEEICTDSRRKKILTSWVHELTPMDVKDFEFPRDPSGRVHLRLCEANGRKVSAYSASDGTLRFLAMLAVLLGENPKSLYFFEEIDTDIHPARLHLLMDLIERQTAKQGIQVITTTHAPTLLTVMNDQTFENTSIVCRLEDSSDAIIRPVVDLPNVRELRQDQGLGRLHESGWMETALYFTEDYDEKDFVAVDKLRDKMRDNNPDYVETQTLKAVAEVNAKS
ncbi:MAG: AAA family ATPase [Gemmatimonadetes bacterium]|nr:AAA family ATPase [Gemmatimonadota bacterium]